ncbi:MAG: RNA polymerase sigma factor [Gemmatimonadaceae bacterium]
MTSTGSVGTGTSALVDNTARFSIVERLLEQWRDGDSDARDQLLVEVHPILYRWALANAINVDDADDIAQKALITVYRKLHQFRGDSSIAAWMYRITTRIALQRHRKRARRKTLDTYARSELGGRVYTTDPGGRVDRDRLTALVREFYDELPRQQRAAITLVDFDGHSPAEAATLMGLNPVTLRANLFKARASIRRRVLAIDPVLAERFANLPEPTDDEADRKITSGKNEADR